MWRPVYIFDSISLNYSKNTKCFREKLYKKSEDMFFVQSFFSEYYAIYGVTWKYLVESDRPRRTIKRNTLHFACRINEARIQTPLMYVCPCIVYENDERYELDPTILFIIVNKSTRFRHLYAHLQGYIGCILLHMVFSTRCCG